MKIWRKLSRIGAVPFKGSGYLLPDNEENYEYFQWLVSEVISLGGEAAFVRAEKIESMEDGELVELFNQHRERDYQQVEEEVEAQERSVNNSFRGQTDPNHHKAMVEVNRLMKEWERIRRIDFFSSGKGASLGRRLEVLKDSMINLSGRGDKKAGGKLTPQEPKDFQQKVWITRKNPYVDRMASAWLIRRFIDPKAVFSFSDENEIIQSKETIPFDMKSGGFTHQQDLCTFEVLIKVFGLKGKGLKKIAEIVHAIDLNDEKFPAPEAKGVEEILKGIRKTGRDDLEILEKGIMLFEALYASKTT
jgi:hypothetical protein